MKGSAKEMTLLSQSNTDKIPPFLQTIQDSSELQKIRLKEKKKKYEVLLHKISFLDLESKVEERKYKYNHEGILPFIYFFKFLAKKPLNFGTQSNTNRLKLWLPDTVVLNERYELPPMWFYSSQDGFVYRTDNFTAKNVLNKYTNYSSQDELVAIQKKVCLIFIIYLSNHFLHRKLKIILFYLN